MLAPIGGSMSQDEPSYVGREFGNYLLAETLGRGGMSVVYRAIHKSIESEVAIKVMRQPGSHDMVKRFFHEAVAASQIRHPGIVSVFDYGHQADGTAYLVMELLQGQNVGDRLRRRGTLDPGEAVRLMRQVCGALIAAHEAEIIHRDIKPQNLFIVRDPDVMGGERIKVLDFGVAKMSLGSSDLDETNALVGTPIYMAPEQFLGGESADCRTDIYQVGAVLYRMLAGRPPFIDGWRRSQSPTGGRSDEPPRLTSVSPRLEAVILRCLESDPSKRYQDMRALEDALRTGEVDPVSSSDESPTAVQRVPDLRREPPPAIRPSGRGIHTLASASVASGFFENVQLSRSRLFSEGGEFFRQVRETFEFYRKHLDDEYRQLSAQIDSAHKLWIACVGVGFAILLAGLLAVLAGRVTQGVVTSSASTMVYFIVRVFQKREDYYREQKATKMKYLQYGNDWLLLIQSIEAIPDAADRLEEQRRLSRVLLERIKREERPHARDHRGPAGPAKQGAKRRALPRAKRSALAGGTGEPGGETIRRAARRPAPPAPPAPPP
jgi:serine/threonine protein kinase